MAKGLSKITSQLKEIGFGTRTFSGAGRLIREDGSYNVRRRGIGLKGFSAYHAVINMNWGYFFLFVTAAYFLLNLIFASVYFYLGADQLSEHPVGTPWDEFIHCFYFSAQTLTTVGYGRISPMGGWTSFVAAIEAMVGLLSFALATGILYGRFSKAKAKISFSKQALISPYRDIKGLKIRMANTRKNNLIELSARIMYSYVDGQNKRRYQQLPLEIDSIDLFPLPWTLVHPIDERSPLFNNHVLDLTKADAEFIVIVKGFDDTFNQYVHQLKSYKYDEIGFDMDFEPMFRTGDGYTEVQLDKISHTRKAT